MIRTAAHTPEQTLNRLLHAMDAQHPVTITYLKEATDENGRKVYDVAPDGTRTVRLTPTVRTIEIYDARPSKAGDLLVIAMDRETSEVRSWRIDRIVAFTVHRSSYTVERTDDDTTGTVVTLRTAEAVIAARFTSPLPSTAAELRRHTAVLTDLLAA